MEWGSGAKKIEICKIFAYDRNKRVLDIGCSKRQAENYCNGEYIGFDIRVVDRRKSPDVLGDAHFLPFKSESFDTILAFDVIEHLANGEFFISECYRILKPSGKTLIITPNGPSSPFSKADPTHICIYTNKRLKSLLETHGFRAIFKNLFNIHSRLLSIFSLLPFFLGEYLASKFVSEMFVIAVKRSL